MGVLGVQKNFITSFWPFWPSKWLFFLKLEHFLRLSLKTRSHDICTYFWIQSQIFGSAPKRH